jgi:hypothetical protein
MSYNIKEFEVFKGRGGGDKFFGKLEERLRKDHSSPFSSCVREAMDFGF